MAWHRRIGDEIKDMFEILPVPEPGVVNPWGYHEDQELSKEVRLSQLKEREKTDPEWAKKVSRGRERRRKQRMAADPEYAAKRKAQYKAAYERRKKRLAKKKAESK